MKVLWNIFGFLVGLAIVVGLVIMSIAYVGGCGLLPWPFAPMLCGG